MKPDTYPRAWRKTNNKIDNNTADLPYVQNNADTIRNH
jgi:hypothetical protein